MLDIHRTPAPDTKIYFTHSILPSYIDPQNVSTKKQPFATLNKQHATHTLDLLLPREVYEIVRHTLASTVYARVHIKLADILDPEFLDAYIAHGNIAMRSELCGDNQYTLYKGVLQLELGRLTYERCGLQGVAVEDGGAKHKKQRWLVTYDLKQPSMKHGKKGFARLEWATRNVLNQSATWLWWSAHPTAHESLREGREVLSRHAPSIHAVEPVATVLQDVAVPRIAGDLTALHDQDTSLDLLEYIHLLALHSPRVSATDTIDAALSRYEIPDLGKGCETRDVVRVRWNGFITPAFAREVFLGVWEVWKGRKVADGDARVEEEEKWFAMCAQAFGGGEGWSVLQVGGRETVTWGVEGGA